MEGCPFDPGQDKMTLGFNLNDFYDTAGLKLLEAGHVPGPKCCCQECNSLMDLGGF